jgi:hypothetical protein
MMSFITCILLLLPLFSLYLFQVSEFLFFTYGSFRHLVGLLGWGDQSSAKASTYTGQHNTERRRHTSMPRAGFEPAIPMFEWPKTVLALEQWYSTFFPPVPLETLLRSTLYPQSCWCKISFLNRVGNARNRKQYKFALERNVIL